VTAFLAELVGAPFVDENVELRAARSDARLMSDQLRRAITDLVAGACRERPLLLVLEDMHWGDRPSLEVIGHALGHLDARPWMVLALARPGGHDLPASWVQAGLREVRLSPLAKRSAEAVVRAFASPSVGAAAVAAMVERGGGNPFALEELARANAAGRDAVPDTVLAMTQARLDALDPAARRTLRAASIFGQVFWTGGVACLLGDDRREVDRALDRLATDDVLIETSSKFPGERAFAFQHAIVREAAYAMLTDADGALGHRLAAAWSVRHGETNPRVLAHHFERGRQRESAATWWCRAARDALRGGDITATFELVDRGLACESRAELRAELWLLRADASIWSGEGWSQSSAAALAL
jgi:predicted ATPase